MQDGEWAGTTSDTSEMGKQGGTRDHRTSDEGKDEHLEQAQHDFAGEAK